MLLCTQLAPARQVIQVGDKISTKRGCPLSRLNSDFRVAIPVSEMTPPLREATPLPGAVVPGPATGDADVHDTRTKPAAAAATTAADRDLRRPNQATRITIFFLLPATKHDTAIHTATHAGTGAGAAKSQPPADTGLRLAAGRVLSGSLPVQMTVASPSAA
jgi:hypothetical protein